MRLMLASPVMAPKPQKICAIIGPTASGKSARAIDEALVHNGEVISVDSRQVYRGLDIGTEKMPLERRQGIPHHLIDIRDPREPYSAGDFAHDAAQLIDEIILRGKLPILVGGTHFYFDALFFGTPGVPTDSAFRMTLEPFSTGELYDQLAGKDPHRASSVDPRNRRRIIRALEIVEKIGTVPKRDTSQLPYDITWISLMPAPEELRTRITARLQDAFSRGLIDEVRRVKSLVDSVRLDELGLEYRVVGEYLDGFRSEDSLLPTLSARLWQYARRQKAWIRKLTAEAASLRDRS